MTDDIVTRLRYVVYDDVNALLIEAADDIDRLRAEIDLKGSRLDDALDEIERLRAVVAEIDALHTPFTDEGDQSCHECVGAWPCRTYSRLHQEEARRG